MCLPTCERMPPKKVSKGKAQDDEKDVEGINAGFFQRVDDALKVIDGHEWFRNAKEADPIGLPPVVAPALPEDRKKKKKPSDAGDAPQPGMPHQPLTGHQAAFDPNAFEVAIASGGTYRCAGNEFWLDPYFSMVKNVPINVKSIEGLMETTFHEPSNFVGTTVILVESANMDPLKLRGSLKRLSPEEIWFAKVLRLAEVLQDQDTDEDTLCEWKVALLGASWQFEYFENGYARPMDGALARSINLRESMVSQGLAVMRDTIQRLMEVHNTKKAMEQKQGGAKVAMEKLCEFYKHRVSINPRSEQVSTTFIESYSVIWGNLLKHKELLALTMAMSEHFGPLSPLNSTTKIRALITKCEKKYNYMKFALEAILDLTVSGTLDPGEVNERSMKDGYGSNRGFIDVLCLKCDLRHFLLQVDLPNRVKSAEWQVTIREALTTFKGYRSKLCPLKGEGELDRTWMAGFPPSVKALINLYEEIIYSDNHDRTLRSAVRENIEPREVMQLGGIKTIFDRLDKLSVDEMEKATGSFGAAAAAEANFGAGSAPTMASTSASASEAGAVLPPTN